MLWDFLGMGFVGFSSVLIVQLAAARSPAHNVQSVDSLPSVASNTTEFRSEGVLQWPTF